MAVETRRSFFGTVATAGLATTLSASEAAKPKVPTTSLIRVGTVGVGEGSHMNYDIWGPMFNPEVPEKWPCGRLNRMIVTHCWDAKPEAAETYAKKFKCQAVKHYYDMVDKVDAMVFAGFPECKWWTQLTKPYLEAGIPCYINRPFAYSMKDAKEMIERSKKYNAPIFTTSTNENMQQNWVARYQIEDYLREGRRILGAHASNPGGELPVHDIHGIYFILNVLGTDIEKVGLYADGYMSHSYAQMSFLYRGTEIEGAGASKNPFMVSLYQHWCHADIIFRLYHDKGWWDIQHEATGFEGIYPRHFYMFFMPVMEMQRMFETRVMPQSYDYILAKTRVFLGLAKSMLEHNGCMITINDIPDDWEAPNPHPDWIDPAIFDG